jgi:hypothetical protein
MSIPSAFNSPEDASNGKGIRPVIFDIIAPDGRSMLPPQYRLVLHVNPADLNIQYTSNVTRQITMGGWVETDMGTSVTKVTATGVTGGFVHLYNGTVSITGPTPSSDRLGYGRNTIDVNGTRRDTIAYDKFLDLLAMFQANGALFDQYGIVAYQGSIKMTFHNMTFFGWFESFDYSEDATRPYLLSYNFSFNVSKELFQSKSIQLGEGGI